MPKGVLNLTGAELERELARIVKENPNKRNTWTEKEIFVLVRLHGKVSNKVIAKALNRSVDSVNNKTAHMGFNGEGKK